MQADGLIQGLRLDSVDDVLGDRQGRFFGEGFKRVGYSLADITVVPEEAGGTKGHVRATAGIHLPDTWSRKGETLQRPHLSTLDGMILAARLTGLYVAPARRLGADARFRVRGVRIKAGNAPDEEGLERFPVSARLRSAVVSAEVPGLSTTTMDCTIGAMSVQVEAEHPTGVERPAGHPTGVERPTEGRYGDSAELDGPWNHAPFGVSHHERAQFLEDVVADASAGTADARLTLVDGQDVPKGQGPTAVDLFVCALQLGQVLLYELDGLTRAGSNTLWMRRTSIEVTPVPDEASGSDGRFRVLLGRSNALPTAEGTWRTARITASLGDLRMSCDVAHLLP
ncbi:AvrD family protein [Streptomyces antibioticus]|uniref:AvrD family protein n=1 Tax=Streptomyces antibioticus TaxID=1890 RepID=UPI00379A0214